MDAMRRISPGRMPLPSLPSRGIITQSKYNLRHRNSTGHIQSSSASRRSDSVNYSSDDDDHMLISDLCRKAKLNQESFVQDDDQSSHILIKDLRARRVYSPQSLFRTFSNSTQNVDTAESKVGVSCIDLEMVDSGSGSASSAENNGRVGEVSKRDSEIDNSSQNVDTVESKVGVSCRDLEIVGSGSGSASSSESNGRAGEILKRDGEIDNSGERLPSEGRSKHEINSILSSISKEYRAEKDNDLYSDGALDMTNEETESPVLGFPYKAQNMDHAKHESVGKGKQSLYFNDCHDGRYAFKRFDNLNRAPKLTTPPDIETCGDVKLGKDGGKQVEAIHMKYRQLTGNTDGNVEETFCPNADDKNDFVKSKNVLRPRLQRKLFKSPGSVSYRRLLPFIMNMIKDDPDTSVLGRPQNDERVIDVKQFQFPLPSPSQEASEDQLRTDSRPAKNTDESRVLAYNSDLSDGSESKRTSYPDVPESPKKLSAKEVARDCSVVPSVNEHIENSKIILKCSSNTKADVAVDVHYGKGVANVVHSNIHGCKAEAIDGGDTSEKLCVVKQECLSPPDADICSENKNTPGSTDLVNTMDLTRSNKANDGEGSCPNATKGKDNVPMSKSVLKPCLQGKLFKTPSSVSYKRLLPFLKDIAKNDCGASKLGHRQKDERGMRSQLPLPFQRQESTKDELKTDSCPMHDTVHNVNAIQETTTSVDSLVNGDCNLDCSPDLPISVARIDSPFMPSSPIINEVMPGKNSTSASHQSSVCAEAKGDGSSNGEMPLNTNLCFQKLQTEDLGKRIIPTVGFKKGILKRNPRGCRGLCTCLNCASFRLHAERAFEFSRNQFLDAEEVALDLMKELSHLRNMLERRTDDTNKHSVLDENQVKEACRKAIAAEQLAEDRLSQMNDDLNIHCKITCSQQPRVKFANYIEEKVISPGRLSRQK